MLLVKFSWSKIYFDKSKESLQIKLSTTLELCYFLLFVLCMEKKTKKKTLFMSKNDFSWADKDMKLHI